VQVLGVPDGSRFPVSVLTVLLLAAAACGGPSGPAPTSAPATTAPVTSAPATVVETTTTAPSLTGAPVITVPTTAPPTTAPPTTAPTTVVETTTIVLPTTTGALTTTTLPVTTSTVPPTTTVADGHEQHDGFNGNPFAIGSPLEPCLRDALGDERFESIVAGDFPNDDDEQTIGHCFGYDDPGSGPNLAITEHPRPGTPELPPRYDPGETITLGDPFIREMTAFFETPDAVADARSWGADTYRVFVSFEVDKSGTIVWPRLDMIVDGVVAARRAGFAVAMTPSFDRGADLTGTSDEMLNQLHDRRLRAAVELAALAERLHVEFFSPAPEAEGLLHDSAFGNEFESAGAAYDSYDLHLDPGLDPSLKVRATLISKWHEAWAPQIREVFSGDLVAHFGTSSPWYLVPSYDRIGITLDHFRLDPEPFRQVVAADLANVVTSAEASGTDWQVHETYFYFSQVADPGMSDNRPDLAEPGTIGDWEDPDEVARLHVLQDDYFRIALDEYDAVGTGRGFDIGGWVMPGMEVAGSAAADTIRAFFEDR